MSHYVYKVTGAIEYVQKEHVLKEGNCCRGGYNKKTRRKVFIEKEGEKRLVQDSE